ncbi:MAG: hydrolase 2, exosortase A system-associated [Burkholderiales bacterium]|nr:hydrolase 2, exosortase A system-associated [Burkholderiales bacterium]
MSRDARPAPEPFFLATANAQRFCIFHSPAGRARGGVLYLHPFADEMNKSRRMAALQSRALAAEGYAVLQIDLFGCGDSGGDFGDATWAQWRDDVAAGMQWLQARVSGAISWWGLRLGAALALDAARNGAPPASFVLWQPALDGAAMLTQFLRLKIASQMLSEGRAESGMQDLRRRIDAGETIEVAGYPMTRGLTAGIEAVALDALAPGAAAVHWFEIVGQADGPLPPAARRVVDGWIARGARVAVHCVAGPRFWSTPEIAECPELVARTTAVWTGVGQEGGR